MKNGQDHPTLTVIDAFHCHNGFIVLIEYDPFIERVQELNSVSLQIEYGKVCYTYPSKEQSLFQFAHPVIDNLFLKRPAFKEQNEFRIVICKDYSEKELKAMEAGEEFSKTYILSKDLRDIAKKFRVSSLVIDGDSRVIGAGAAKVDSRIYEGDTDLRLSSVSYFSDALFKWCI